MTSRARVLTAVSLAWWVGASGPAFCAPVMLATSNSNERTQADLTWPADSQRQYDVQTRTNLMLGAWNPATNAPVVPTSLIGRFQSSYADSARFFRVVERDASGPTIVYRYPAVNGIGVGRSAVLTVAVEDETGVDTNTYSLSINDGAPLANGSAGVACQTNLFQYTPGTNVWGLSDGTASVRFVCADIIGNTTTSRWSFALEAQSSVTNTLIHLRPSTSVVSHK